MAAATWSEAKGNGLRVPMTGFGSAWAGFGAATNAEMLDMPVPGRIDDRAEAERWIAVAQAAIAPDRIWIRSIVDVVADFVVRGGSPAGVVTDADADWLISVLGERPSLTSTAILFAIVRKAEKTPPRLAEQIMRSGYRPAQAMDLTIRR
jgi:hypothetical protein